MKSFPIKIINAFQNAYSRSQAILIPYAGGEESSDGILYRFQDENDDRLLKIMFLGKENARSSLFHLESRLRFVAFLHRGGVRIIKPLPSLNDRLFETLDDENGIWIAYAMKRIPGKTMSPKVWDPVFVQNWGELIGKCHRVAQDYPDWEYCIDPVNSEKYLTWESEWENFHRLCNEPEIKEAWESIGEEMKTLPINRDVFGFIQNDPHIWNIMTDGKNLTLLDFDVANHHWFINDIAIACQHVLMIQSGGLTLPLHHRDRLENFLKVFLQGYQQENYLSRDWLDQLDLFFAYRRILLYTVMEDWRMSKPDLQKSWKKMIINRPEVIGKYSI